MLIDSMDGVGRSQAPSPSFKSHAAYVHDPWAEVRVERLRSARWCWEQGAVYQAIAVYMEMLLLYRGLEAAAVAAEELLQIASTLEQQGRWYTALHVYTRIEQAL